MNARFNSTPLECPFYLKPGLSTDLIRTVGDAALFITKLPKEHDGRLHWSTAGANLEAADRHPKNSHLLGVATRSMKNALETEKMLRD
jgi:hypothetical protein